MQWFHCFGRFWSIDAKRCQTKFWCPRHMATAATQGNSSSQEREGILAFKGMHKKHKVRATRTHHPLNLMSKSGLVVSSCSGPASEHGCSQLYAVEDESCHGPLTQQVRLPSHRWHQITNEGKWLAADALRTASMCSRIGFKLNVQTMPYGKNFDTLWVSNTKKIPPGLTHQDTKEFDCLPTHSQALSQSSRPHAADELIEHGQHGNLGFPKDCGHAPTDFDFTAVPNCQIATSRNVRFSQLNSKASPTK